jgi:hypothetical protein
MGMGRSPDIVQQVVEDTLRDIADVDVYIDDTICFSSDYASHLTLSKKIRFLDHPFAFARIDREPVFFETLVNCIDECEV